MRTEGEEFVLGDGVSAQASPTGQRESAVLSVRLLATQVAELESIGEETGRTVTEVAREAVRAFVHASRRGPSEAVEQPFITMSFGDATFRVVGRPKQWAKAGSAENSSRETREEVGAGSAK